MPKLTYKCPVCDKPLKLKSETLVGDKKLYSYECGHAFARDVTKIDKSKLDFTSADGSGKKARHYQEDGIEFILNSDFNAIVGDQMRLGKTPQVLLALKNKYSERTPTLIIVKSANLWQWIREYKVWCDTLPNGIFPIIGSKAWIPPGFSAYILSMDTFSKPRIVESLKNMEFKLIIADEAHSFKNTESNRSQALVDFVKHQNTENWTGQVRIECLNCKHTWDEEREQPYDKRIGLKFIYVNTKCPQCNHYVNQRIEVKAESSPCGVILLTGTPILNRADEYFVPLNLVNPEKFGSLERFRHNWLEQDSKGRWNRVKSRYLEAFKQEVSPYLIRREKEDVYTDLPALNKISTLIEVDTEKFKKAYNQILDDMELELAKKSGMGEMMKHLMKLRRICGLMKIPWAVDYLEEARDESDTKYAIGIHHESVRDLLYMQLGGSDKCMMLSGADNSDRKDHIMRSWATSNKQFLVINMLAGGVGMDFHYCSNVLVMERQWNSEIESQFEFRFYNPDKSIKSVPTFVEYPIAKGTIDQWFYDLIEAKRAVVGETVYNNFDLERDVDSFQSLVERTMGARL